MESIRLTKYSREKILNLLMAHKFRGKVDALAERSKRLADEAYKRVYGKHLEQMNSLPKGWLPEVASMSVTFGSVFQRLYFGGHIKNYNLNRLRNRDKEETRRVLADVRSDMLFTFDDPLMKMWEENEQAERILSEEYNRVRSVAKSILNSVTTTKRLIEEWPEIEPFVRQAYGETKVANLPSIDVKTLNEMFELPVEEVA